MQAKKLKFTLLYRKEAWTKKKTDVRRIQALEMWRFRRILNTFRVDKFTNVEVIRRIDKHPEKDTIFWTYAEGREISTLTAYSKRKNFREEVTSWLQNLIERFRCYTKELF